MPTQCKPFSFAFQGCQRRRVSAAFDGGSITSNAGALLLREIDRFVGLFDWVVTCFTELPGPAPHRTLGSDAGGAAHHGHPPGVRGSQRPRRSAARPAASLLADKLEGRRMGCAALAGKSTLKRLEHAPTGRATGRYHRIANDLDALQAVLVELFVDLWQGKRPSRLVVDIDSTDDGVHGPQEGRFFRVYYGHYCFLPLYITWGGRPLFALLRPGNSDPAKGVTGPLGRIVARLRQEWPWLKILLGRTRRMPARSCWPGARTAAWTTSSAWRRTRGSSRRSDGNWPTPRPRQPGTVGPHAGSPSCSTPR